MPGVLEEETPGLAGCIKWLPPKDKLPDADSSIEEGCCNHPVMVMPAKISEDGKVEILIITSFGGSDLKTKYPHQTGRRHDHLPIAPSEAHPDNGILLTLRDPLREMRKRSYVKTKSRHRILFSSLRPYDRQGPDYFLSRRSFDVLVEHAQLSEYNLPLLVSSAAPRAPPPSIATTAVESRRSLDEQRAPIFQWTQPLPSNQTPRVVEHDDISSYQIRVQMPSQARNAHYAESGASRYGRQQQQQQQSETQPLLDTARRQALLRLYGQRSSTPINTILPTSHRVRATDIHNYSYNHESKPFDWNKFWIGVEILLGICAFLAVSYGAYRAGVWVVQLVRYVVKWVNDTFVSMGEKISALW